MHIFCTCGERYVESERQSMALTSPCSCACGKCAPVPRALARLLAEQNPRNCSSCLIIGRNLLVHSQPPNTRTSSSCSTEYAHVTFGTLESSAGYTTCMHPGQGRAGQGRCG